MGVEAILAIGGLFFPPVFDLFKKWFLPATKDTPEATMSTLATTKPEVLPRYTEALAYHLEAQTKFFNRDVVGTPSQWIVDLRAAIRPIVTGVAVATLIVEGFQIMGAFGNSMPWFVLPEGSRGLFILAVSQWFGSRLFGNGK